MVVDRYRRERVLVVVALVRTVALGGAALAVSLISSPLPAYAIVGRSPSIRLLSALGSTQTFTRGCFAVLAVVVALQLLGLHQSCVGVLTAGFGAGAVLGSFAASLLVRSSGFGRWLAVGVAGWGIPFIALATTSSETIFSRKCARWPL